MGEHLIDGEFQSDKYPTCQRGKVPLSVKDKTAQDLLWEYAQRRRAVDASFSDDLEAALKIAGYVPHPGRLSNWCSWCEGFVSRPEVVTCSSCKGGEMVEVDDHSPLCKVTLGRVARESSGALLESWSWQRIGLDVANHVLSVGVAK